MRACGCDVLQRTEGVGGEREHAEHDDSDGCAERGEPAAEQDDDEQLEREEGAVARRVAYARELHRECAGDTRNPAGRSDRRRVKSSRRHAKRARCRLTLSGGREAEPDGRASERREREGGEQREPERELVVRRRGRATGDDDPLGPAEEPPQRLQRECDEPRHDPRGCGEPGTGETRERDSHNCTGPRAGDAAGECCDGRGSAMRKQVGGDDRSDGDERALREARQTGNARCEREPDRRSRQVEACREVDGARVAEEEGGERRECESGGADRRSRAPGGACLACGACDGRHRAHSTASAGVRARHARRMSPSASGTTSR